MNLRILVTVVALATLIAVAPADAFTAKVTRGSGRWQQHHVAYKAAKPSSDVLLRQMLNAADAWWSAQGSPPPCPYAAQVQWGAADDVHQAFAYYRSCVLLLSPRWWATQYAFLTSHHPVRARRRAAAFALAILMHERGHNIGYGHIPGTVMQAESPVVPGWAFLWARAVIG